MEWYAVYDALTKDLVSVGTTLGEDLAARGLIVVPCDGPQDGRPWNKDTLSFDPAPPPFVRN